MCCHHAPGQSILSIDHGACLSFSGAGFGRVSDNSLGDISAGPNGAPASDCVVRLDAVSKRFSNGTLALSDLSLTVKRGAFISLLGPSGCGKSTTLRLIAGLSQASTGTVAWPALHKDAQGLPDGDVGFVFQDPTLMPWANVFANVYLPFKLRGVSKAAARRAVMEAIENVGLLDVVKSYPRELSGGMRMRVSIARALATKPKLLLMDEPFAALDEITRQKLNDDVYRLWQQTGVTVVFVTHSVFESAYLSNRIVVMRPQPGAVHAELDLVDGAARNGHYRLSQEYRDRCAELSLSLQEAMELEGAEHD